METKFKLFGYELMIDNDLAIYTELRNYYVELAEEQRRLFIKGYHENVDKRSIESFAKYIDSAYESAVDAIVSESLKILVQKDIFSVRAGSFQSNYEWEDFDSVAIEIIEEYNEIIDHENQLKYQRALERGSRGQWSGGTIGGGMIGAIRGAAKAKVLNIGTGLVHGVADAVTEDKDNRKIAEMKRNFVSDEHLARLQSALYLVCFAMHLGVYQELRNSGQVSNVSFLENAEKSKAIFENTRKYLDTKTQREKVLENLFQAITISPFISVYYEYLVEHFDDPENEICKIANYFGVSDNILNDRMERIIEILLTHEDSQVDEVIRKYIVLEDTAKKLSIPTKYLNKACLEGFSIILDIELDFVNTYLKNPQEAHSRFELIEAELLKNRRDKLAETAKQMDSLFAKAWGNLEESSSENFLLKFTLLDTHNPHGRFTQVFSEEGLITNVDADSAKLKAEEAKIAIVDSAYNWLVTHCEEAPNKDGLSVIENFSSQIFAGQDEYTTKARLLYNNTYEKHVNAMPEGTLSEVTCKLSEAREGIARGIGLDALVNRLDEKFTQMEVERRTVNNVVFTTVDEAETVRSRIEQANDVENECDKDNLDSVTKALEEMRQLNIAGVLNERIEELEQRYNDLEIASRTFNGKVYDDVEKAGRAEEEYVTLSTYLTYIGLSQDDPTDILALIASEADTFVNKDILEEFTASIEMCRDAFKTGRMRTYSDDTPIMMHLREPIAKIASKEDKLFSSYSDIPDKKYNSAKKTFLRTFSKRTEYILLFHDSTLFGSSSEGFCITIDHIYCKLGMTTEPVCVCIADIDNAVVNYPSLKVHLSGGKGHFDLLSTSATTMKHKEIASYINYLVSFRKSYVAISNKLRKLKKGTVPDKTSIAKSVDSFSQQLAIEQIESIFVPNTLSTDFSHADTIAQKPLDVTNAKSNVNPLEATIEIYKNNNGVKVGEKLYMGDNVPEKKLLNAINSYAKVNSKDILLFFDETVFGSAKHGFVLTPHSFYFNTIEQNNRIAPVKDIIEFSRKGDTLFVKTKSKEGKISIICADNKDALVDLLNRCIKYLQS